jgi:hypothetical protein
VLLAQPFGRPEPCWKFKGETLPRIFKHVADTGCPACRLLLLYFARWKCMEIYGWRHRN